MTIDAKTLKQFARRKRNVLLRGRHGVGKTALIKETFNEVFGEMGKNWRYFSASTLDPWVDLIGIPKNYTRADGKEVFGIIPPESFSGDEDIRAIFFDEINRTPDNKTLNALMELIQFKSINGRVFKNLEVVWGAENPAEDSVYMVMPMDPAQKDRFHIQVDVPYEINADYFDSKFGASATKVASAWWQKNKDVISPRKLDDMLDGWKEGLELRFFSNDCKTINELQHSLGAVTFIDKARAISQTGDESSVKTFFNVPSLRKFAKVLAQEYDILEKIYPVVDGESQAMIRRDMGYTPPLKAEDINSDKFSIKKPEVDKILGFVSKYSAKYNTKLTNTTGGDFMRNAANRAHNIFGAHLANKAEDYVAIDTIIRMAGPDNVIKAVLGDSFDSSWMNSGVYKEASLLSANQLNAFKTLNRVLLIALRSSNTVLSGVGAEAYEFVRGLNGSSLMSRALSRNPVRSKACMSHINSQAFGGVKKQNFGEVVADYMKIYS